MAKIDVFNMCYGVGAVNSFDRLMRQKPPFLEENL